MLATGWEHLLNSTLFKLGQLADHVSYIVCGGCVLAKLGVTSTVHQPARLGLRVYQNGKAYASQSI